VASAASSSSRNPAAATPAGSASTTPAAQPSVDVTALTTRDEFLLEFGQALAGQAAIRPVDSLAAALESLTGQSRRGQVLVLDACKADEVLPVVKAVEAGAPQAVILVFAPAALEPQLGTAVLGSSVFAVLPSSPVNARKTLAVFAEVIEKANQRLKPAVPADFELETTRYVAALEVAPLSGGKGRALALAALVCAGALAAGAWYYLRGPQEDLAVSGAPATAPAQSVPAAPSPAAPAQAALPPAPTPELSVVHGQVDELLEKARLAMRERRYTEPAADNALLYYRSAAAADASDAEAHDGLARVAAVIASRFDEALAGGRLDQAAQDFANFRAAVPDDARIADLGARLANAQLGKGLAAKRSKPAADGNAPPPQ
jgi:hypothetical protein